jgi:clan AA aspartic protease
MGLVYANIELINLEDEFLQKANLLPQERIRKLAARMNVDSGAYMMCINESTQIQLGLKSLRKQSAIMANGDVVEMDIVGPIRVNFENRTCTVDAYVLPGNNEMLLGAIPMEYMDVLIHPKENKLIVNPEHPTMPQLAIR